MKEYALDAWAIMALIEKEEPAASEVRSLIKQVESERQVNLSISVVNIGEVYYTVFRRKGETSAEQVLLLLRRLPVTWVSADDERVLKAAGLKAQYRISYADAFAVALALELDATLVTGDPELLNLATLLKLQSLVRTAD